MRRALASGAVENDTADIMFRHPFRPTLSPNTLFVAALVIALVGAATLLAA